MKTLIEKLKALRLYFVIGSAKPKAKTLEERVEVLEKLCDMYYKELYTHYTDDVCMKGERISRIDRLEKHCL